MAVLFAYFDESGTNAQAPVLSVAAYYGTKEQWEKFERLWLPIGKDFHARCSSDLFPRLVEVMEQSEVEGVLCTVSKDDFKACASAQFKSQLGNAYAVATFSCAMAVCDAAKEKGIGSVSFVVEHGQPNVEFVKKVLESMLDTGDTCIASVASAKKSEFAELHTADFAAHVASAYKRSWLQTLIDRCQLRHCHHQPETFVEVSAAVRKLISLARKQRFVAKKNK